MSDTDPLTSAMDEEIAKGPDSDVPENALASISLLKDYLSGKDPSREALNEAVTGGLNAIQQKKLDLATKLKNNQGLTSSQTVGLGVLALGLLAAGGAMKGKRGMAMAGNAFLGGGGMAMKQIEQEQENQRKVGLSELSNLNKQEADLTKTGVENKLAPVKTEETIGAQVEAKRRKVAAGLENPNGTTINMPGALVKGELPTEVQQELMKIDGAVAIGDQVADKLSKLPDTTVGTIQNQIQKHFSATDRGEIESQFGLYRRIIQAAIEGKRGSDQDNQVFSKILAGDFTASGPKQAQLINQANDALRRIMKGQIETYQQLGTPEGVESFKKKLSLVRAKQPEGDNPSGAVAPKKIVTLKDGSTRSVTKSEFQDLLNSGAI